MACARKLFMQFMTSVGPMQSAPTIRAQRRRHCRLAVCNRYPHAAKRSLPSDGSCIDTETACCGATAGVVATATKPIAYLERSRLADNMG